MSSIFTRYFDLKEKSACTNARLLFVGEMVGVQAWGTSLCTPCVGRSVSVGFVLSE